MRRQQGFTLIELMIAMAVIAILTAIALPSYTQYVIRGKLTEAHANLADLRVKMEQFYQDNRTYIGGPCAPTGTAAAQLKYFSFSCSPAATATTYTIQAVGSDPGLIGITFTIDQSNTHATTVTASSKMANNGYTTNAACWETKKGAC